ncbi:MAG: glycogen debranching protein GlgX [Nitratireductor sp.]
MVLQLRSGRPNHLGARYDGEGTNFAVFSANASAIELCIFTEDGKTEIERVKLPDRTGHVWHGYAPGLKPGTKYGLRAHGVYAPDLGHRFNPHKLLLDPYAREFHGDWINDSVQLGYIKNASTEDLSFDTRDSAPFVPKSVISHPELFEHIEPRKNVDWSQTLIYEAHPKGLTKLNKAIPKNVRGTYEALASDEMLEHLQKLGITAIELLPVHSFVDDGFLIERNLKNYWGYNTIGFFAPEPRYFGPNGLNGFRTMVRRFHAAGIKVILDVVYNHTAEGDQRGPTFCYRGLDNASYYRLIAGQPRFYVNDTGCGNTVNVAHPYVLRMVMDSLRFWVQQMGIDGFRFDLATTLAREDHGFDRRGGFFDALRQDPVLSDVKLIAEPWDIGPGGYQLGNFPSQFSEWNDGFRDSVRKYWRGDEHSAQEVSAKLLGSAANFDREGRRAWSSINLITSHDGFTLADLTRFNDRHNEANGENGADGHGNNLSDNCGVEGYTDDPQISKIRSRRERNLLATLFLSQGTPMLLAGDEFSNSQQGNNNAYAQDNEIGWLDWENADQEMIEFVSQLSKFRKEHPCLTQTKFLHGNKRSSDSLPDVEWTNFEGEPLQWRDPGMSNFCLIVRGSAELNSHSSIEDTILIIFNRKLDDVEVKLPTTPENCHWVRSIDTAATEVFSNDTIEKKSLKIFGTSVVAAYLRHDE